MATEKHPRMISSLFNHRKFLEFATSKFFQDKVAEWIGVQSASVSHWKGRVTPDGKNMIKVLNFRGKLTRMILDQETLFTHERNFLIDMQNQLIEEVHCREQLLSEIQARIWLDTTSGK